MLASSPWCTVAIDGSEQGVTPIALTLSAGPHTVALVNTEFQIKRTLSVVIEPNQTLRKRLDFQVP
jgi:hypothetical protein